MTPGGRSNTRADQVRQRRSQNSQRRMQHVAYQAQVPAITQPVIMRRGMGGTPVIRRTRTPIRRKFTFAIGNTGAEMTLPAIPVIRPGWRLLSGMIVILLGGLLAMITNSPQVRVASPTISGLKRLSVSDVQKTLDMNDIPIYLVDPRQIEADIAKAYPDLTNISVSIGLPASVSISVTERKPIMAWKYQDKTVWIDEHGVVFPAHGDAGKLVTIDAESSPPLVHIDEKLISDTTSELVSKGNTNPKLKTVDVTLISAALKLSKLIPKNTILAYTDRYGLGWKDTNGWSVYVGPSLVNLDAKLQVYRAIVDQLNKQGIQPAVVNVEQVDAPFYRLEQ
jgi:uncharacterized protein (DUF433 family)